MIRTLLDWTHQYTVRFRYRVVARPLLSTSFFPDTAPRAGCLCDCPISVTVTVTTYALVAFQAERVLTVQQHRMADET
jgi:hypothetical protein